MVLCLLSQLLNSHSLLQFSGHLLHLLQLLFLLCQQLSSHSLFQFSGHLLHLLQLLFLLLICQQLSSHSLFQFSGHLLQINFRVPALDQSNYSTCCLLNHWCLCYSDITCVAETRVQIFGIVRNSISPCYTYYVQHCTV